MFLTSELKENAVKLIIRLLFEVLGDKTTGNTFLLQTKWSQRVSHDPQKPGSGLSHSNQLA